MIKSYLNRVYHCSSVAQLVEQLEKIRVQRQAKSAVHLHGLNKTQYCTGRIPLVRFSQQPNLVIEESLALGLSAGKKQAK